MAPSIFKHWNMRQVLRNCKTALKFYFYKVPLPPPSQLNTLCPQAHSNSFVECSLMTVSSALHMDKGPTKISHWGFRSLICGINLCFQPSSLKPHQAFKWCWRAIGLSCFNFYSIHMTLGQLFSTGFQMKLLVPQDSPIWVSINLGSRLKYFHTQMLCLHQLLGDNRWNKLLSYCTLVSSLITKSFIKDATLWRRFGKGQNSKSLKRLKHKHSVLYYLNTFF